MKKLTALLFTATLTLTSGSLYAATVSDASGNNGQANASAEAGQHAPDAHQNQAPNKVDNNRINSGNGTSTQGVERNMSASDIDKNSRCKDGHCPDINSKVQTNDGGGNVDTRTDGTSQ